MRLYVVGTVFASSSMLAMLGFSPRYLAGREMFAPRLNARCSTFPHVAPPTRFWGAQTSIPDESSLKKLEDPVIKQYIRAAQCRCVLMKDCGLLYVPDVAESKCLEKRHEYYGDLRSELQVRSGDLTWRWHRKLQSSLAIGFVRIASCSRPRSQRLLPGYGLGR